MTFEAPDRNNPVIDGTGIMDETEIARGDVNARFVWPTSKNERFDHQEVDSLQCKEASSEHDVEIEKTNIGEKNDRSTWRGCAWF